MHVKLYPEVKLASAIEENPSLLFMLEYFNISSTIKNKTIDGICKENQINPCLMVIIGDLYNNRINTPDISQISADDIPVIIKFLKNTHLHYKNEKYPEIENLITKLKDMAAPVEINQIEIFFKEYFKEVVEHLDYEDKYAFPYICDLLKNGSDCGSSFSATEYKTHHSDIETKLSDLKTLLLQHIRLEEGLSIRRKILLKLFELQNDLIVHSKIEEQILIPIVESIENQING